ncbi:MAG: pyridoxamine 5'-phosphate oxidase family protein [Sneathiella sp.]|nr:pyridoxamine 5'-phosphate oxidase family protein [Sneathiella sp.]
MSNPHTITSIEQLEQIYGEANPWSLKKETPMLTTAYQEWLERSPFFALATSGADGRLDCSPRGDGVGTLFQVLDDRTLLIPDRRGNNRLDSLKNIVENPNVATMFIIPGISECLRINGKAHLSTDPDLCGRFDMKGKLPQTVIVLKIETVYFQCARAILRAGLWDGDAQLKTGDVPTAGQMVKSAAAEFGAETYDAELPKRQSETLY